MEILFFAVTLAIAAVGGYIGLKLKLPAGAMVGAMVFTVVFNLIFERAVFFSGVRVGMQIFSGALVGSRIGKSDLAEMKRVIVPIIILIVSMLILNLTFGTLMYAASELDIATSLFASAPGGVSDMAIICADLGANPAYVAILQLVRILTVFILCPPIFRAYARRHAKGEPAARDTSAAKAAVAPAQSAFTRENLTRLGILLVLGAAGGLLLYFLGVSAGAMIGSMICSAAFCILRGKVKYPTQLSRTLQVCSGAYIGIRLDRAAIMQMDALIIPLIIMVVGIMFFVFVVPLIIHKVTGLELTTCMMASTPGGVQEMSLLSEELGADTPKIAVMQTCRLMSVIMFFPTMIRFVAGLFM